VRNSPLIDVLLRTVIDSGLAIFFDQQQDAAANWMAAFTSEDPTDRAAFAAKWARILGDDAGTARTIVCGGQVAGNLLSFVAPWSGQREVSYWVGREYWGRGVATKALAAFVCGLAERPLYARAAADNVGSIRVLKSADFYSSDTREALPSHAARRLKKWSWSCVRAGMWSGNAERGAAADRGRIPAVRGILSIPRPRRLSGLVRRRRGA
jgi:RimJ/RimL family protein N-acetyltransferase